MAKHMYEYVLDICMSGKYNIRMEKVYYELSE